VNASLGVQLFPYPFRDPATDDPIALGTVTTVLTGTSTQVATFSDAALTTPNPNPLTLTSAGYATMYFSPLNAGVDGVAYDVTVKDAGGSVMWTFTNVTVPVPTATGNATTAVVGFGSASTLTISGGAITPTKNVHLVSPEGGAADDLDTLVTTGVPDGALLALSNTNGAAAITVRNNGGGTGNIYTSNGSSVVLSGTAQRILLMRYGSNWFQIQTQAAAAAATTGNSASDGRLTLTSGTPVTTSDVTAAGTVYYTPYTGNFIDLYDGSSAWSRLTFSELSVTFTASANGVYDLFVYNNAGVATLVLGSAWSTSTSRALGLSRQNGVLVLASDTRYRYVGTVSATSSANQTEDSLTKRYLWNYYHRVSRTVQVLEATASWVYTTATYRQTNGSTGNQIDVVAGVAEDSISLSVLARAFSTNVTSELYTAVGLNSTTSPTTQIGKGAPVVGVNSTVTMVAQMTQPSQLGRNSYVWLERGSGVGTVTWYGVDTGNQQAGLTGSIRG
jgi:hypothetical protein